MSDTNEITADEASEILGVSSRHVLWYHANGHLPGRRVGKRLILFPRNAVEALKANKPKKTGRPRTVNAEPAAEKPPPAAKGKPAVAGPTKAAKKPAKKRAKP